MSVCVPLFQLTLPRAKTYGRNWVDPLYFRRIPLEHTGRWKQYSNRNFLGFFLMIFDRFLPESTGNWQEFTEKHPKNFRPEYCFHFRGISAGFPRDTVTFRILPAGSRRIWWPESSSWVSIKTFSLRY